MNCKLSRVSIGCLACVLYLHQVSAQAIPQASESATLTEGIGAGEVGANVKLKQQGPPIYHVEDGDKLWPLVGFTLDQFQQLFEIQQGLAQREAPPRYVLLELSLSAELEDQLARIAARLKVRSYATGLQIIQFGASEAQLDEPKVTSGQAAVAARFNENWNGYELLLEAEADAEYVIEFGLLTRVRTVGGESQLKLSLPRAASSDFQAVLPGVDLVVDAGESMFVTSRRSDGDQTRLKLAGLTPDFQFSWRPPEATIPPELTTFDVHSRIDVEVDSRGLVTSIVEMDLRTYNRPVEEFTVRVPAAARLEEKADGYTITLLDDTRSDYHEYRVLLNEPRRQPTIRLLVQFDKQPDNAYELAGYDVPGALEQSGTVQLFSEGNWQLNWKTDTFARRISSTDSSRRALASFAFGRPNQIRLTLAEKQSQLTVKPRYELEIQESDVVLKASFQYTVRGASSRSLSVTRGAWEQIVIGPQQRVPWTGDQRAPRAIGDELGSPSTVEIPLLANSNDFVITMDAVQLLDEPLSRDRTEFELELPVPVLAEYDRLLQSTIVIKSAPNVVVDGNDSRNPALAVASLPDAVLSELADETVTPLCYQTRERVVPPRLKLAARALERTLDVFCEVEITDVNAESIGIRQTMRWKIDNVQLSRATLMVADEIYHHGNLRVAVNGSGVAVVPGLITFAEASGDTPIIVSIPPPAVGTFELTFDYQYPLPTGDVDRVTLPLIVPKRDKKLSYACHFLSPRVPGYRVELRQDELLEAGDWLSVADDPRAESLAGSILATSNELANEIPLSLQRVELSEGTDKGLTIDRAWFQSWFNESKRRDRAVFRVQGSTPRIRIDFPLRLDGRSLYVLVDGQQQANATVQGGFIAVEVDQNKPSHVIDIVYPVVPREAPGILTMEPPRIENGTIVRQWFWHVVVPRTECLIASPRHLTADDTLGWSGWFEGERKDFAQTSLEDWATATRTQPRLLKGSRDYLFSALGEVTDLSVRTTSLAYFVLLSGGAFFVIGLLLIYAQRKQRTALLLIVSVTLAAAIFVNPTLAALVGQAAVVGFGLVTLAATLRWVLRRASIRTRGSDQFANTRIVERSLAQERLAAVASTTLSPGSARSNLGVLAER